MREKGRQVAVVHAFAMFVVRMLGGIDSIFHFLIHKKIPSLYIALHRAEHLIVEFHLHIVGDTVVQYCHHVVHGICAGCEYRLECYVLILLQGAGDFRAADCLAVLAECQGQLAGKFDIGIGIIPFLSRARSFKAH